ncbi:MAG: hypothetical protein IAE94_04275 [Chthoniobacterales bacterium]|nr:hypothetical protein [Chthoniobacterales bacterium]
MAYRSKQTKKEKLEDLAVYDLPAPLQAKLEVVRQAINSLKAEAADWGVNREFSPDGRFLGDVGELIAKLFFGVALNVKQQKGHDAIDAEADAEATIAGRTVEVKLRSRSTNIHFSDIPDIALVIYVSPDRLKWGVVCNGPGETLLANAKQLPDGKMSTDCHKLLERQKQVQSSDPQLRHSLPVKPAN